MLGTENVSLFDPAVARKCSSSVSTFCPLPLMQCECFGAWIWIYVLLMNSRVT